MPPLLQASVAGHVAGAVVVAAMPAAWPWVLGGVALDHALITATGLWPRSTGLGPNLRRLPDAAAARRQWCLTIDDGPDPEVTPQVLDLLEAHGAKASFFCIASQAARHPALVRGIVERGHDVHNHSQHHRHHFSLMGPRALAREVGEAQALLADLTGVRPTCFRAPAGLRNPFLDPVLHRLDLHLASWTRRGFDTREGNPQRVLGRLERGLAAGDILLLHDGHAARTPAGRSVLLEVLPSLLAKASALGLRTTTLTAAVPPRHAWARGAAQGAVA